MLNKIIKRTFATNSTLIPDSVPTLREFLTLDDRKRQRRSLEPYNIPNFDEFLSSKNIPFHRLETKVLQINIGLHCNQSCNHCHVESSPQRMEMMNRETVDRLLYLLENNKSIDTIDITGGAPELNYQFRYLVENIRKIKPNITIIDRCNLTVLYEDGQQDLKEFLAENKLKLICSLPCYSKKNVNRQRGKGVFDKSIQALIDLNSIGFGMNDSRNLEIDLVYNPIGAFLPPSRDELEKEYKHELYQLFNIKFNYLHVFNNQPIKRFADFLYRRGELGQYMTLLVNNFNEQTINNLMCTNTINVSWSGHIYDCDFNQMLELQPLWKNEIQNITINNDPMCSHNGPTVFDINDLNQFNKYKIATDVHCFACVAGSGSKCGT